MQLIKFIIFLFPFFKPSYFIQISVLNKFYNLMQVAVAGYFFVRYLKRRKYSLDFFILFFIEVVLFTSSIIDGLSISDFAVNIIQTLAMCIVIDELADRDTYTLVKALKVLFNLLVLMDFVFVLQYPIGIRVGLYNVWLFGAKNAQISFILPAIFCSYLYYFKFNKFSKFNLLKFIALILIGCYILYMVQSSTSIVVIVIFLALLKLSNSKIFTKFSMKKISVIYLLIVLGLVFLQIQNLFADFIINVLHKDLTFTGRTYIWNTTLDFIKRSPLYGYGLEDSSLRIIKMQNGDALHAHNMVLEILYSGGFLVFGLFSLYWKRMCDKVDAFSQKHGNILKCILIAYCIELLTEAFSFEIFLWVLVFVNKLALSDLRRDK